MITGVFLACLCLDASMSARVQPKELWNRAEIQAVPQEDFEQKPFISILHDTAFKSDSESETDLQDEIEASAVSASSLISRAQSSEKALASMLNKVKREDGLAQASGDASHNQTAHSQFGGVLLSFVELTHNYASNILLAAPAQQGYYCGAGIVSLVLFACFCCWMDWAKTVFNRYSAGKGSTWQTKATTSVRNQYLHKGRVVYEWEQTSECLTLFTPLPNGVKKKDIEVKFWPHHMKMGRTGKAPFIKEELFNYVAADQCKWAVTENGELAISLQKASTDEWPCVFKAHHPDRRR